MARHLEETDIPIEYRGMKYNVSPSALRSNNLTVELPEVVVRPTTPQTNDKAYYQRWLIRQASRGGKNMSLSDREAYDRMMRRIANQNEVNNFTGFDGTIYNHGNGALEQVSPEFDVLTLGRQLYTDGLFNAVGKNIIKKGKNTIASYDLYNNIKNGIINENNIPSKILYRANVYRGGKIKYPKYSFFTTDKKYASQYGKVNPYIFESKNIAVAKEPLMGYKDPVNRDIMLYHNTKSNPSANAIIGYDKITGEFPYQSRGAEILNLDPNNIFPIKVNNLKTINFNSIGKNISKKVNKETSKQLPPEQWTPEQWTAAQDAAIARGDMAEAQRLRDLHFQVSAPNTKIDVPLWTSSEETFNSFDLSHFGETDSGFFGYGHYLTPMEKYAATYHPINRRFYVNMENPYIGSNDQYFNRIQYVKDRLAKRKENIMRNLRDGKLTRFSKKLGINENTSLEEAENLVDKYIKDETVKWNNKYVKYTDEFEGKDGVLSWRELQGIPNKQEGIYKEVIVPKGEQIKSADAVTYGDDGVRIPLGKRDNFKNMDIRYGFIPLTIGGKYLYNKVNNNK